jgi:signal transduction histidine kinase
MSYMPNILVVDDNESYLLYLDFILKNTNANIIKAGSAAIALETTRNTDMALAILDVQMPGMNGFELALELNKVRTENKIPIIFLTALTKHSEREMMGYESGAVDFIFKPLNKNIFLSKVNIFLELFWQKQRLLEKSEHLKTSEKMLIHAKKQLEQVNVHLINAIEEERANISYQVHDELGQSMTALKMDLNWVRQNLLVKEKVEEKIDKMLELTNEVIKKVQHISLEMHPGILDDLGLVAAIDWYTKDLESRSCVRCKLKLDEMEDLLPSINLALFRIIQESLTNVIRHSKATTVTIELLNQNDEVYMSIADNGIGIPTLKLISSTSFGIISMRQRARLCGGTISFTNVAECGLKVEVRIPKKTDTNEDSDC